MSDKRTTHNSFSDCRPAQTENNAAISPAQTIYIVAGDKTIRQALATLLHTHNLPAKTFDNIDAFAGELSDNNVGCLILDIQTGNTGSLDIQEKLLERNINMEVIFITDQCDLDIAVEAMKKGALEFLKKPVTDQRLMQCIYHALEINRQKIHTRRQQENIEGRINSLSKREHEVMDGMINGDLTKVIAAQLGISPRTAEIHRHHVMEKMQVKTLAQLVQMVLQARQDRE